MDRAFITTLQERHNFLTVIIGVIAALVVAFNIYGLSMGLSTVFPHLFYIPIILTAYYFPSRGTLFACAISAVYFGITLIIFPDGDLMAVAGRIAIFILVGAFVSFLTRRMRESEMQFRGVAERSSDIILLTETTGKTTYVSPSVKKILGYEPAELNRKMPVDFFHPDDLAPMAESMRKSVSGTQKEAIALRMKKKDGNYAFIEFFGSPIYQEGQINGIQVIGRDVTERKRVEDKLRDTSRRLAEIIDFLPDPTFVIDRDGKVVAWNRACEELTGIPASGILGKGDYAYATWFYHSPHPVLIDMVLHGDLDAIEKAYPRYRRQGQTIRAEAVTHRPDGTSIDFWLTAVPLSDENGKTVGAIESLRDVTHQKMIDRALRESNTYLDAVINTMADPLFIKDREYRFVKVNDSFCQFTGHSREELVGKTDYDFFRKDEADTYRTMDDGVFATGHENENEETLTDSYGNTHTIVTKKTRYTNTAGEEFIVGIIRDITERKQTELALMLALKKLNMLSSITRHDILNQLMGLRAFLELTREQVSDPELLGFIAHQERAAEAIQRQIEFTRIYQDLGVKAPQWQEVEEVFRSAAAQLPLGATEVSVKVGGILLYADPLIGKVFYNLIENTLRHGGEVSLISLDARETGDGLVISYRDNGAGVDAADKRYLFQKGFGKNTGLGLFLSREILSITGIMIDETGEPERGVCFEIRVPKGAYRMEEGEARG
ncbi:MAG: hypothetical protein CVV32_02125 [Methanomicrobiales archaeon HGW-Methanomicrobiales-3]|jgi:PAS domain S-box-containing protein|nr:MAG: hypothetical protein CVV32_02125 [Methanomicrobiales archaeon HGW-Methanomicrobiales-3]